MPRLVYDSASQKARICYAYHMKVFAENKKAYFEYQILEKLEAGLALTGPEVKSVQANRINISSAYITISGRRAFLLNATIAPYQPNNQTSKHQNDRTRQLLLSKSEILYLQGKIQQKGLTILPLKVYTKKAKIKVEIALAKGKKLHDKREAIKKRENRLEDSRDL